MTGDREKREPTLRERALKLLARREHSRKELGRKLAEHTDDPLEVERALDECEARGWLSEQRAVEQLVHNRRSRFGLRRIERDLEARGISVEARADVLARLKPGEMDAARAVWRRKFGGKPPRNPAERARQARFLQGRGFELAVVLKVIEGEEE